MHFTTVALNKLINERNGVSFSLVDRKCHSRVEALELDLLLLKIGDIVMHAKLSMVMQKISCAPKELSHP